MNGQRPVGSAVALLALLLLAGAVFWLGRPRPQGIAPATGPGVETGSAARPSPEAGARRDALPGPPGLRPEVARAPEPSTMSPAGVATSQAGAASPSRTGRPAQPNTGAGEAGDASRATGEATSDPAMPSFDLVRVEPNGEAVIAGRGVPNAAVELIRNGEIFARSFADGSGLFALVPPPLPPGSHEVVLQTVAPNGVRSRSRDSVTVVVGDRRAPPLVALTSPDRPTVVLSQPGSPETRTAAVQPSPDGPGVPASPPQGAKAEPEAAFPATPPIGSGTLAPASRPSIAPEATARAGPASGPSPRATASPEPGLAETAAPSRGAVKVVSVEAEEGGRLYVSGLAAPGSTVRLYLNETLIAPGGVGRDGRVAFAIGRGVRPGDYRVRLDDVDPVSGAVRSRAEVAFNMPEPLGAAAPDLAPATAARSGQRGGAGSPSTAVTEAPPAAPPASTQPRTPPAADLPASRRASAPAETARPPASPAQAAGSATVGTSAQGPATESTPPPSARAGPARGDSARPLPDPTGGPSTSGGNRPAPAAPLVASPKPDVSLAEAPSVRQPSRQAALDPPRPGGGEDPPLAAEAAPRPTEPADTRLQDPSRRALEPAPNREAAAAAPAVAGLRELDPGTIVVPEINTAIVSRGETLWRISRRVYGRGLRYTIIYSANQEQIRNPRFIYPGQVFVLPGEKEAARR